MAGLLGVYEDCLGIDVAATEPHATSMDKRQ